MSIYKLNEHKVLGLLHLKKKQRMMMIRNKMHKVIDINALKGSPNMDLTALDFEKESEEIKDLQEFIIQIDKMQMNSKGMHITPPEKAMYVQEFVQLGAIYAQLRNQANL